MTALDVCVLKWLSHLAVLDLSVAYGSSSLIRDQSPGPCTGAWSLVNGPPRYSREVITLTFLLYLFRMPDLLPDFHKNRKSGLCCLLVLSMTQVTVLVSLMVAWFTSVYTLSLAVA